MNKIIIIFLCFLSMLSFINLNGNKNDCFTIYLDPGHGGRDAGAVSGEVYEKNINLAICLYLKEYLENSGFIVYLTRDSDIDLSNSKTNYKKEDIRERVKMINNSNADLYLSIHTNAISSNIWRGAQVFYNKVNENNFIIAKCIQDSIKNFIGNTDRVEKEMTDKFIVSNVLIPGALVEVGFISNNEEKKLLNDSKYQDKMAYAIYLGILEYIKYRK